MKHSILPLFLCLIPAILISGCNGLNGDSQSDRLARVGNEYLTLEEARKTIPDFLLQEDSMGVMHTYVEDWIQKEIILQEAERLQLRQNKDVQEKLEKARREILSEALKSYVMAKFNKDLVITDEEARNYYQIHKDKFILNERFVRFRHVETPDLEAARAAKRDLMLGVPWPEVARNYSISPETKIEKSEHFWPASLAVAELDVMNRYLNGVIGQTEISPIRRIGRNYHFVQLMDSKAKGEHPDLHWLIEQIKDWLIIEKRRRHYSSYIKNLYLKAKSNNEIDNYHVLTPNSNTQNHTSDPLETVKASN